MNDVYGISANKLRYSRIKFGPGVVIVELRNCDSPHAALAYLPIDLMHSVKWSPVQGHVATVH